MDNVIEEIAEILRKALAQDVTTVACVRTGRRTRVRFSRNGEIIEEWVVAEPAISARIVAWIENIARRGGRQDMPPDTISVRKAGRTRFFRLERGRSEEHDEVVLRLLP